MICLFAAFDRSCFEWALNSAIIVHMAGCSDETAKSTTEDMADVKIRVEPDTASADSSVWSCVSE